MKEILITNDDGFEATGLLALKEALNELDDVNVTIVAPSSEKSACAHSLTLTRPLRFIKLDDGFFKLDDATPSDCVYLALHALYNKKPDLVISGINHGANLGEDITYSGTCGAAMEGVLQGIRSIAFSQFYENNSLNELSLNQREFLNVNIPATTSKNFKGYAVVPAGRRTYATHATLNRNPRGIEYYWLGNAALDYEGGEPSDISKVNEGFATITPIKLNMTSYESLESLKGKFDAK